MNTKRIFLLLSFVFALDLLGASKFAIPANDEGLPGEGPIRRYQWFQNLWEKKRTGWAKQVKQDQGALVFLGDSITQGWGDNFRGHFKGVKVANRGISGDTTRGVLIRLKEDVLSLNPKGVVILIGTNDLEEKATPEVIAGNLKLIIAALKKHNAKMPIILCNTFPSSASKRRPADQIKKINQLYFAGVKGDAQITVLDTWLLFADAKGDAKKPEFPDLLHPNQIGYDKWAASLRPLLATHGFMETDSD
ncbi:MAG: SGNH/GDSL hydrolase family protein [Verrucomicrobiota bacterium]|nr:SGNH/GDSL hydrolase family protein [Verrucomicrobiota bacterium]